MAPLQFPAALGMDFSGIIEKVGDGGVSPDIKHGDEVYGQAGVLMGGSSICRNGFGKNRYYST
jgi:NADPH:quinone reductase-like Zn-dependent oxidoreductase